MIKVISSFADGPLNFNPISPAEEDRTQKLISALKRLKQGQTQRVLAAQTQPNLY